MTFQHNHSGRAALPMSASDYKMPTREERKVLIDAYAIALGRVVFAWNHLHEVLALLFVSLDSRDKDEALSSWYKIRSDRDQRERLKKTVNAWDVELPLLVNAKANLLWLIEAVDALSEPRNDAVHAPVGLHTDFTKAGYSEIISFWDNGHPRAQNLKGKDLITEFGLYETDTEALIQYTWAALSAVRQPQQCEWPTRPNLLTVIPPQ